MNFGESLLEHFSDWLDVKDEWDQGLVFPDEGTCQVLKAAAQMVKFPDDAMPHRTRLAGCRLSTTRSSAQFEVDERVGESSELVRIDVSTDTSSFEIAVFVLQSWESSNLLVSNTSDLTMWEISSDWRKHDGFSPPGIVADRVDGYYEGVLLGLPKPLQLLEPGKALFTTWYEGLGMALGTSLLELGQTAFLADDFSWTDVLTRTWQAASDSIRVG